MNIVRVPWKNSPSRQPGHWPALADDPSEYLA